MLSAPNDGLLCIVSQAPLCLGWRESDDSLILAVTVPRGASALLLHSGSGLIVHPFLTTCLPLSV